VRRGLEWNYVSAMSTCTICQQRLASTETLARALLMVEDGLRHAPALLPDLLRKLDDEICPRLLGIAAELGYGVHLRCRLDQAAEQLAAASTLDQAADPKLKAKHPVARARAPASRGDA
jgi:hypothetical protein